MFPKPYYYIGIFYFVLTVGRCIAWQLKPLLLPTSHGDLRYNGSCLTCYATCLWHSSGCDPCNMYALLFGPLGTQLISTRGGHLVDYTIRTFLDHPSGLI